MERLFAADFDLGPSAFFPPEWRPRMARVEAPRNGQLAAKVRESAPKLPGVYVMLDAEGKITYVGKAKELRTRLLSYFRVKSRDPKAGRIIRPTKAIVWETLPHEFAALLRELELIRRWRPFRNVQGQPLRRRHAFLELGGSPATLAVARRGAKPTGVRYGPIAIPRSVQQAVRWFNDLFALRDCPPGPVEFYPPRTTLFASGPPAGCLRLELGSCLGPCVADSVTPARYREAVDAGRAFLDGTDASLLARLDAEMRAAAADQRFEKAALLRDQREALASLSERLTRARTAQTELSGVYRAATKDGVWWYLLHGARVLRCVAAPVDAGTAEAALAALRDVFRTPLADRLLDAYEPVDGMTLTMHWFRKHAKERRRLIAWETAETQARRAAKSAG